MAATNNQLSKTGEATHTKVGVHVYIAIVNIYLHEILEPILNPIDYSLWSKRESNISETKAATPTKIVVHACDINPYLHKFFELISID